MTPAAIPHGTDEHPDVTEISDLIDGLLPQGRAAEVRAHIEQCTLCGEVRESLVGIRSALGTLPGPARMPADVAGRIDAALAAEALLDASAPAGTSHASSGQAPKTEREDRRTGARRGPAAHGTTDVSRETARPGQADRPPGHAPASAGPGRANRRRRRSVLLTTAGIAAVLGLGGALLQGIADTSPSDDAGSAGESVTAEGGGDHDGLERRVQSLVAAQEPRLKETEPPGPDVEQSPNADAPLAGGATAVPSCVRNGIDRGEQPLAVDSSKRYQGRPSYLVVLPHPGDPQRVDAYVVDSTCATGSASGPGDVLLKRTYARD